MLFKGLSFDAIPPFRVPFRFFITAPVFAIFLGLLFLLADPAVLTSRFSLWLLAATHAITLGFMMMIMLGALFQILPVVGGVALPKVERLAKIVHLSLTIGVASLLFGFLGLGTIYLTLGGGLIFVALSLFLGAVFSRFRAMLNTPPSWAIRLSIISLLITFCFGLSFVIAMIKPGWLPNFHQFTNLHLMWGIFGWTLLLVMGVSSQIIPMFYVTRDYPRWISKYLAIAIFVLLILLSLNYQTINITTILINILVLLSVCYAGFTLYQISIRKRKTLDITLWFWNTAMLSIIIAAFIYLINKYFFSQFNNQIELLLATLMLVGFAMALITGMLLKIVPFLVWLNLQQAWIKRPTAKMPLSNMHQVIPNKIAKRIYWLFLAFFGLALAVMSGVNHYILIKLMGMMMIITYGYLFLVLIKSNKLYQRLAKEYSATANRK